MLKYEEALNLAGKITTSFPYFFSIEKSLFKNSFGHNFCNCQPIFKNFCCTFYDKISAKYYQENILTISKKKKKIEYRQKFVVKSQNTDYKLAFFDFSPF